VHPNLDLKVTVGSTERSLAMLRSGAGDLGLLTLPIDASDMVSVPVLEEELLVATYPNHPLAMKRRISPADLNKQPFILFETGSITRRLVDEFFTRERIHVDRIATAWAIKNFIDPDATFQFVPRTRDVRGMDGKHIQTEQLQDHAANRLSDDQAE